MDRPPHPTSLDAVLARFRGLYGPEYRLSLSATFEPDDEAPCVIEARFERVPDAPSRDAHLASGPGMGRLLTLDEVADLLQVSRRTLNTIVAEGELSVLKVRNQPRVTPEGLQAYLRGAQWRGGRGTR